MARSLNVEAACQVAICNMFQHRVDIVGRMAGNHAPCRQNSLVSDINHDLVSDTNDDLVSDILVNHDDRGQNRLVSDIIVVCIDSTQVYFMTKYFTC